MSSRKLHQRNTEIPSSSSCNQYDPDLDSWDYHYHKIISSLTGTQQEKQAIIRKRILRYFGQFNIQSQSYFSIRNDVDYNFPGIQIMPSKLILFGIDYLNIQRGKHYFAGFVTNIRKIDDSHFIVQFRNEADCLNAINKCKIGSEMFFSWQDVQKRSSNGWIDMKPYYQFIFQRKLKARFATNLDRFDNPHAARQSHNFAYNQAKRRYLKSLKQDYKDYKDVFHSKVLRQLRDRSNQSKRSREKVNKINYIQQNKFSQKRRGGYGGSHSQRPRRYDRSRSRSRSSQIQGSIQKTLTPKALQEQYIKQSDFKFNLYTKRRDNRQNNCGINLNCPSLPPFASYNPLSNQDININQVGTHKKSEKTNSTSGYDIECQIVRDIFGSKQNKQQDATQMEFQRYLQNLKLQDSKNDYSAFQLDVQP